MRKGGEVVYQWGTERRSAGEERRLVEAQIGGKVEVEEAFGHRGTLLEGSYGCRGSPAGTRGDRREACSRGNVVAGRRVDRAGVGRHRVNRESFGSRAGCCVEGWSRAGWGVEGHSVREGLGLEDGNHMRSLRETSAFVPLYGREGGREGGRGGRKGGREGGRGGRKGGREGGREGRREVYREGGI